MSTQSCPIFATPWTVVSQAPLFMGFPRQEYQSRLPFPPLGDLPDPEIELVSLCTFKFGSPALQVDSFPSDLPGKPKYIYIHIYIYIYIYILKPRGDRINES